MVSKKQVGRTSIHQVEMSTRSEKSNMTQGHKAGGS